MMTKTNPRWVQFEMDIFWVVYPGQQPVEWLKKYGKRWQLMHLKDMRKGVKTGDPSGPADVNDDAALGAGQMNLPEILAAARKAGVKWYFIEDESSRAAVQIPLSLSYLEQVKW
jgi:sugar phosphate isomerase/epimerase